MNNTRPLAGKLAPHFVLAVSYLLFAANLLRPRLLLLHDSGAQQRFFHFVYSQFFLNGEVAEWMPDAGFGSLVNHLHVLFMTAPAYFMMIAGKIGDIHDAFLLFKMAIAIEGFILQYGMYLLLRAFAIRPFAAAICSTVPLLTAPYLHQHALGFSDVHMLPIVFYFFLKAFRKRSASWFWGGAIMGLLGCRGYAAYNAVIFFNLTAAFVLYLFIRSRKWTTPIPRSIGGAFVFVSCVILTIGSLIQFAYLLEGFQVVTIGRDEDGKVTLNNFLAHGGVSSLRTIGRSLFTGLRDHEPSLYAGLLTLFFAIYAQPGKKRQITRVMTVFLLTLLSLSLGGVFSIAIYHLPLMNIFRNLQYVHTFLIFLITIIAAFGLNKFLAGLKAAEPGRLNLLRKQAKIALGVLFGLILLNDLLYNTTIIAHYTSGTTWSLPVRMALALLVPLLLWADPKSFWRKTALWIIAGAFLFDVGYYNTTLHRLTKHARFLPGYYEMRNVRPLHAVQFSRRLDESNNIDAKYTGAPEYNALNTQVRWRPDADAERIFGYLLSELHSPAPQLAMRLSDTKKVREIAEKLASPTKTFNFESNPELSAFAKVLLQPCGVSDTGTSPCILSEKLEAYDALWWVYVRSKMGTDDFSEIPATFKNPERPLEEFNTFSKLYYYDLAFFRDLDVCNPLHIRWDVMAEGYLFLKTKLGKDHAWLESITGCSRGRHWVRFPEKIITARTLWDHWEGIEKNAKNFGENSTDVLHILDPAAPGGVTIKEIDNAKENLIFLNRYTSSKVEFTTRVFSPEGAYLYWSDSHHPGWKALLDGAEVPVLRANMGYKAVFIPRGDHKVRFVFDNGVKSLATQFNAIASALSVLCILFIILRELKKQRSGFRDDY